MRWYAYTLLVLVSLVARPAVAHPHMWIDGTFDLELDGAGVVSMTVRWLFDEFNSADMIFMFDDNLDGELSRGEQTSVREEAFSHLSAADYFIVAFAGEDRLGIPQADGFRAEISDGRLVYEFTVPLRVSWNDLDNFVVALFDQSYFIDFLADPARPRYAVGGRTVALTDETLRLSSDGWGTINVPALRVAVQ